MSIKVLLDQPADKPLLEFPVYSKALANLILNSPAQFAIGIFGGWGTGKTTLMEAIQRELASSEAIIPVRFSAWRYEREEHLIVPLLDVIRDALSDWAIANQTLHAKVAASAKRTALVVGKAVTAILAGVSVKVGAAGPEFAFEANKALERASRKDEPEEQEVSRSMYYVSFKALHKAFADFSPDARKKIVIFVDDLDRCMPKNALQVLESMKLFFDLEGFVFVVGLDREIVKAAVAKKFRSIALTNRERASVLGDDYIKKIFQVPFTLPPIATANLDLYIDGIVDSTVVNDVQKGMLKAHLHYVVLGVGINPREIKRYINAFSITKAIRPLLQDDVLLAFLTIDFRPDWKIVFEGITGFRETFLTAVAQFSASGDRSPLVILDPNFGSIPSEFLEYVRGPAAGLLTAPDIEQYIFGSFSVTAQDRPSQLIAAFLSIRPPLTSIQNAGNENTTFSPLNLALEESKKHVPSTLPAYLNDVEAFRRESTALEGLASADPRIKDYCGRLNAWLTATIKNLSQR